MEQKPRCPACGSDAYYRYGKAANGKPRYLCLICNRQFVNGYAAQEAPARPNCPKCGAVMHVYMRYADAIRYRCKNYPECRGFFKVETSREL